MKRQWKAWAERINARGLRERLLIFAMAALIVVTFINLLALDPLQAERKQLGQQLTEQQARIAAAQSQVQALVAAQAMDPDAANRARLADLRARIARADTSLETFRQGLVSPDRMADLLKDLLARNRNLRLVSLRTLPVAVLDEGSVGTRQGTAAAAKAPAESAAPRGAIYRHSVEVTIEGSYGDLLDYVSALEALPWKMYWGGAELSVQTYPTSRLTLTLYTLSLEKVWLSV
jgi:MSHA biogenesis protein MshJ